MWVRAVAIGYAVVLSLTFVGVRAAAALFPQLPDSPPTTGYLTIAIAVCFVSSVLAAYLTARVAPDGRKFGAIAVLVLSYAATAALVARLTPALVQPRVVLPLTALLAVVGTVAGVMIERAIYGMRR